MLFGRRNASDLLKIQLVRRFEDIVRAEAKERQRTSTGGVNPQLVENFPQAVTRARDELGKMAGVSGKHYEHGIEVLDKAPESVVEATRNKEAHPVPGMIVFSKSTRYL